MSFGAFNPYGGMHLCTKTQKKHPCSLLSMNSFITGLSLSNQIHRSHRSLPQSHPSSP